MEAIVERVAGVDVGQAIVVATVLVGAANRRPRKETRRFRTLPRNLPEMREWFLAEGVTHVGMESTGVYWKPLYTLLEDAFEVIVGNAHHIKNVPGRKTDVKDSEWLAELVRHGLVAKSFVPPKPFRDLRDLIRYRRKLVESRTAERNRLLKLLETANIKLSSVATDVFGVSGMRMLQSLTEGRMAPRDMAELAKGRLRGKLDDLELALDGRMEEHHRFLLRVQLRRLAPVEADIADLDTHIDERLKPYESEHTLLKQIPGVDRVVAAGLVTELGTDMTVFHGPGHIAAWVGVCPGNNESAGRRRPAAARKGNVHLRTLLMEAASGVARTKGTYLRDKFFRLKARRGYKRAIMAIAHKILVAAYHMLRTKAAYRDLGETYLDRLDQSRVTRNLVRRLERLGYDVKIEARLSEVFS
jgi:transposase